MASTIQGFIARRRFSGDSIKKALSSKEYKKKGIRARFLQLKPSGHDKLARNVTDETEKLYLSDDEESVASFGSIDSFESDFDEEQALTAPVITIEEPLKDLVSSRSTRGPSRHPSRSYRCS